MEKRKALYLELKRTYDNGMPIEKIPGGLDHWRELQAEAEKNGWDKPKAKPMKMEKPVEKMTVEDLQKSEN